MRNTQTFQTDNFNEFKIKLLLYSKKYKRVCFLDSNNQSESTDRKLKYDYDFLLALGSIDMFHADDDNGFDRFEKYHAKKNDWLFGHFSYDLKNNTEKLTSNNLDNLEFPAITFFIPRYVISSKNNNIKVQYLSSLDNEKTVAQLLDDIQSVQVNTKTPGQNFPEIKSRISKKDYIENVNEIKKHIQNGDIYEMNFCQEYYASCDIQTELTYLKLTETSPTPFAAFYKLNDKYMLCASPERFIKKTGATIISQPIKGTRPRHNDAKIDNLLIHELQNDIKERAENVMIVDLVRNDLARTAKKGTVKVDELCEIYSFSNVHQMISTISSELKEDISPVNAIRNAFPMGSMTGAPKIRAMKLIEQYEETKRGLYSGSIGYFTPGKDFDFNVVIRSILYNAKAKYLSFSVGSAITIKADPEKEYQECLVKISAIEKVLK